MYPKTPIVNESSILYARNPNITANKIVNSFLVSDIGFIMF